MLQKHSILAFRVITSDIIYQVASRKLHCTLVRELRVKRITNIVVLESEL